MRLKHIVMLFGLASATVLAGGVSVEAAPARTTANLVVRSGPGAHYRIVGHLRAGDRVNVTRCAPSRRWCHVQSRRTRNGWVNARFLDRVRGGSNRPSGICFYGQRGQICLTR
jgi:uncharacterized protein YraI